MVNVLFKCFFSKIAFWLRMYLLTENRLADYINSLIEFKMLCILITFFPVICVELLWTCPLPGTVLTVSVLHGCLHESWCHVTWHIDNGCFIFLCVVTIDRKCHSVTYSAFLELHSFLYEIKRNPAFSFCYLYIFFYFQGHFILDTFLALN